MPMARLQSHSPYDVNVKRIMITRFNNVVQSHLCSSLQIFWSDICLESNSFTLNLGVYTRLAFVNLLCLWVFHIPLKVNSLTTCTGLGSTHDHHKVSLSW